MSFAILIYGVKCFLFHLPTWSKIQKLPQKPVQSDSLFHLELAPVQRLSLCSCWKPGNPAETIIQHVLFKYQKYPSLKWALRTALTLIWPIFNFKHEFLKYFNTKHPKQRHAQYKGDVTSIFKDDYWVLPWVSIRLLGVVWEAGWEVKLDHDSNQNKMEEYATGYQ